MPRQLDFARETGSIWGQEEFHSRAMPPVDEQRLSAEAACDASGLRVFIGWPVEDLTHQLL